MVIFIPPGPLVLILPAKPRVPPPLPAQRPGAALVVAHPPVTGVRNTRLPLATLGFTSRKPPNFPVCQLPGRSNSATLATSPLPLRRFRPSCSSSSAIATARIHPPKAAPHLRKQNTVKSPARNDLRFCSSALCPSRIRAERISALQFFARRCTFFTNSACHM
jgi:hypothetical protein